MVKTIYALAIITSLNITTCNTQENYEGENTSSQPENSETYEAERLAKPVESETVVEVTSASARIDSMMKLDVPLPPVYYHNVMESSKEATEKFASLSKASQGKMKIVVSSDVVAEELSKTINVISRPNADLLLLIDRTCSMGDDIDNAREGLSQILDTIKKYRGTRLAVATYGDKNCDGEGWFTFKNFETNYEGARKFINDIKLSDGCDLPESVYDALLKCKEQDFFRSTRKRNIILIGDAPPQEKPQSDYDMNDVIKMTKEGKIVMNFYPIIIVPQKIEDIKLSETEKASYQQKRLAVTIYPNPSSGRIEVSMIENGSYYMEIYDVSGAVVSSEPFFGIHYTKNLQDRPNGTYVLRIIHDDHRYELMKFVIQR